MKENGLTGFSINATPCWNKFDIHITPSNIDNSDDNKLFNYYKEHHSQKFFKNVTKQKQDEVNKCIEKIHHDAKEGELSSQYNMNPLYGDHDCKEFGNILSGYMQLHGLSGFQINSNEFKVVEGNKILKRGCNVSIVPKKE